MYKHKKHPKQPLITKLLIQRVMTITKLSQREIVQDDLAIVVAIETNKQKNKQIQTVIALLRPLKIQI